MTSPSDYDDLVQAELDGCASGSERVALAERLAIDPAAKDHVRRMRSLVATLEAVEPVSPPAGIVEEIMRRVRSERQTSPRGFWVRLRAAWPSGGHVFPYAYAAAAGAALCFVAIQSFGGGAPFGRNVASGEAVGTMGAPASIPSRSVAIEAKDVRGNVRVRSEGGRKALDIQFQNLQPVDVFLRFDPSEASFAGISDPAAELDRVTVADGEVRWSQAPGRRVTVVLAPRGAADTEVRIGIDSGGKRHDAGAVNLTSGR